MAKGYVWQHSIVLSHLMTPFSQFSGMLQVHVPDTNQQLSRRCNSEPNFCEADC
jgi:hypothetical protein